LVRQPKTAVFSAEIEVQIYRTPALEVLRTSFLDSQQDNWQLLVSYYSNQT